MNWSLREREKRAEWLLIRDSWTGSAEARKERTKLRFKYRRMIELEALKEERKLTVEEFEELKKFENPDGDDETEIQA